MKNKYINSEEIAEGINKGFWKPIFWGIIWGIIISVVGILILSFIFTLIPQKIYTATAIKTPCMYDELTCKVFDKNIENKQMANQTSGGFKKIPIAYAYFCGWTEANSWLQNYQKEVGGELYLECE